MKSYVFELRLIVIDEALLARKAQESAGEPVEGLNDQIREILRSDIAPLDAGIELLDSSVRPDCEMAL
jgi:hypothetical protein